MNKKTLKKLNKKKGVKKRNNGTISKGNTGAIIKATKYGTYVYKKKEKLTKEERMKKDIERQRRSQKYFEKYGR